MQRYQKAQELCAMLVSFHCNLYLVKLGYKYSQVTAFKLCKAGNELPVVKLTLSMLTTGPLPSFHGRSAGSKLMHVPRMQMSTESASKQ